MNSPVPGARVSYIRSNVVTPPARLHLNRRTRGAVSAAKKQLCMLPPAIAQQATRLLEDDTRFRRKTAVRHLSHDLSAYVPDVIIAGSGDDAATVGRKETGEREAFTTLRQDFFDSLEGPEPQAFFACLAAIAATCTGDAQRYRLGPIGTQPDRFGRRWLFPDSSCVRPSLLALRHYLARDDGDDPLVRAVVAHCLIGAMHPFVEGNGRTARVVFNLLVGRLNGFTTYLPLRKIFNISRHGYEIRMRHTVATADWTELIHYFCNVIGTYHCAVASALRTIPRPPPTRAL